MCIYFRNHTTSAPAEFGGDLRTTVLCQYNVTENTGTLGLRVPAYHFFAMSREIDPVRRPFSRCATIIHTPPPINVYSV